MHYPFVIIGGVIPEIKKMNNKKSNLTKSK
jgi:hypothetical protein